jgi:membrane protease YdiL (CAAX protease family)
MNAVVFSLAFALLAFAVFAVLRPFDKRLVLSGGLLFAAYLGLDDLATSLQQVSPVFNWLGGRWNWEGKLYSLALAAIVMFVLDLRAREVGLTLAQRNLGVCLLAVLGLTALSAGLGFVFRPGMPDGGTLLFQATMPGLAEELAYRGIAPAILLALFHGRGVPDKVPWVVVLIAAIPFGVWHGWGYSDSGFSFDPMSALFPFIGGIAYGWLRFKSGSLLLPVIAHGLGNCAFYLASVLA